MQIICITIIILVHLFTYYHMYNLYHTLLCNWAITICCVDEFVPIKEFEFEFILKFVVCNLNKIICLLDLFVRLKKEEKMWINVYFISFSIAIIKIYIFVYLPLKHFTLETSIV